MGTRRLPTPLRTSSEEVPRAARLVGSIRQECVRTFGFRQAENMFDSSLKKVT
jgi:hypothetical protein